MSSLIYKDYVASLLQLRILPSEGEHHRIKGDFDDLFTSSTAEGAMLGSICVAKDEFGGVGLFATCDIAANDMIATMPRHLRIGQQHACKRLHLPSGTPDLSALSLFILSFNKQIVVEIKEETDYTSPAWTAYAKTLPGLSEFRNAAAGMSGLELEELSARGADYATAVRGVRRQVSSCSDYVTSQLSSAEESPLCEDSALRWAISMVLSRSHAFGSKNRWLTPIFDLANHRAEAAGGGSLVSDDQGRLVLMAGNKSIACGEEVMFDYQCLDDAQTLATYGFSII